MRDCRGESRYMDTSVERSVRAVRGYPGLQAASGEHQKERPRRAGLPLVRDSRVWNYGRSVRAVRGYPGNSRPTSAGPRRAGYQVFLE